MQVLRKLDNFQDVEKDAEREDFPFEEANGYPPKPEVAQ